MREPCAPAAPSARHGRPPNPATTPAPEPHSRAPVVAGFGAGASSNGPSRRPTADERVGTSGVFVGEDDLLDTGASRLGAVPCSRSSRSPGTSTVFGSTAPPSGADRTAVFAGFDRAWPRWLLPLPINPLRCTSTGAATTSRARTARSGDPSRSERPLRAARRCRGAWTPHRAGPNAPARERARTDRSTSACAYPRELSPSSACRPAQGATAGPTRPRVGSGPHLASLRGASATFRPSPRTITPPRPGSHAIHARLFANAAHALTL